MADCVTFVNWNKLLSLVCQSIFKSRFKVNYVSWKSFENNSPLPYNAIHIVNFNL